MRIVAMLLALGLAFVGPQAYAEPAGLENSPSEQTASETPGLLMLAQAGAERVVRQVPVGLTDAQVYGIAAGVVAAAVVGDLAGLNGAGITALAAVGGTVLAAVVGALGNWLLSEPVAEALTAADKPDGAPHSSPPTPAR